MSRIGKSPIPVPSGVDVSVAGRHITVRGPKGTLERDLPGAITVRQDGDELVVERPDDERQSRAMHGLVRSLVHNMVQGVTEGPMWERMKGNLAELKAIDRAKLSSEDQINYDIFRSQLEEDIARFKTRLEHIDEPGLRRLVNSDIVRLKARKVAQIRSLAKRLRAHSDLARRLDLVLSIPGIGERTALALIIRMPELGLISREEAAALAGLAPFDEDSGKHRGQRHIAGGRGLLRRSLFAAALPAAFRWNKALIAL